MGDAEGQGSLDFIIFLDENHCCNPHLLSALAEANIRCEKHLDHFQAGAEDVIWLPYVAAHGWCLLTTDDKIRRNHLEKECIREAGLRMFYFSRNELAGAQMGAALRKALPRMRRMYLDQQAPFTASLTRTGEVTLRDTFKSG